MTRLVIIFLCAIGCLADLQCKDNEIQDDCPRGCSSDFCPTSEEEALQGCPPPPSPCPPPTCKCRINSRRVGPNNNTCIDTRQCPPFECNRPNEEFNPCPPYCPSDSCSQATPDGSCPKLFGRIGTLLICSPKCRCIKNYWRQDGVCVPYAECPQNKAPAAEPSAEPPVPETPTLNTSISETSVPDTSVPDTTVPDTTVPDTTVPDTSVPDTSVPDTSVLDNSEPDTSVPETSSNTSISKTSVSDLQPASDHADNQGEPGNAPQQDVTKKSAVYTSSSSVATALATTFVSTSSRVKKGRTCTGPNEEYVLEKKTCPRELCSAITSKFPCENKPPFKPGCACKSGFFRINATSPCVTICDCPQMAYAQQCLDQICTGPNEEYVLEKSNCPVELCSAITSKIPCENKPPFQPGCACKSGFFRINATSPCVTVCDCPQMAYAQQCLDQICTGPNEEYVLEKSNCLVELCSAITSKIPCENKPPFQPGCACKSGFFRINATSPCVTVCDCPQMAYAQQCLDQICTGPNEEYVLEKSNCPVELCSAITSKIPCENKPPFQPGCACKSGFFRINATSPCVTVCDCPQMAYAQQCLDQICTGPNEEYVLEKSNCPVELCSAITSKIPCENKPPFQPGCACKSGFFRINATSRCVTVCDCPEMAYSLQCP